MDQKGNNNFLAENIEQTFFNNLKFIDKITIIKVLDKLIEKDKNEELNLVNIIGNIKEEMNCDDDYDMDTTKASSQKNNSNSQTTQTTPISDNFSSSNEMSSFKDSNEAKLDNSIDQIVEDIYAIIKSLSDKEIEDILSQVMNYFIKSDSNKECF